PEGRDRDVSLPDWIRRHKRHIGWFACQPGLKRSTHLLRLSLRIAPLSDPNHFDERAFNRLAQPGIDKVQAQHAHQPIEQSTDNVRSVLAAPDGGQGLDANQIVDAALQMLDFIGAIFRVRCHGQSTTAGGPFLAAPWGKKTWEDSPPRHGSESALYCCCS